jgi:hypothetical protein
VDSSGTALSLLSTLAGWPDCTDDLLCLLTSAVASFKVFVYLTLAYDYCCVLHALMYGVLHKIFIGTQTVKILFLLLKQKVYHCVHKSWLLLPVELVESSKYCFSNIHFNIILPFMPMTRTWLLPSVIPDQKCIHFVYLCSVCCCTLPAQCYQPCDMV